MATRPLDIKAAVPKKRSRSPLIAVWRFAKAKPLGAFGGIIILLLVFMALFAEVIALHDPLKQYVTLRMTGPGVISPEGKPYILGGDEIGRDLFSRIVFGARTSLFISMGSVALGTAFGTMLGLVSGYFEGKTDMIVQRVMDAQIAIPGLILAMILVNALPASFFTVILAIGISQTPGVNRVVRGATLNRKNEMYVDAARAMGATALRITTRHILPNVAAPIIIVATASLGGAILVEASLSYLGLGTPPPEPSWGRMIAESGRRFIIRDPKLLIMPGIALSLVVLGFNLLGDAVRDILDPRLRGSR